MATNASILAAFERMWQHISVALSQKTDIDHLHDDRYYTEGEIDTKVAELNEAIANASSQPDWNQNNEAANDYIKNRPFYEVIKETVFLEEHTIATSVDATEGEAPYCYPAEDFIVDKCITLGNRYIVTLNGVELDCTARIGDGEGIPILEHDNLEYATYFMFYPYNDNTYILYFEQMSDAEYCTISINEYMTEVKTIDPKYLPPVEWSNVQNKPFKTVDIDTLTWDGNVEGLECVILDQGAALYHISDIVLSPEDFTSGCIIAFDGISRSHEYDQSQEDALSNFAEDNLFFEGNVYSIPYDNYDLDGLICPKKGIYFFGCDENGKMVDYVSKFTIRNYTGFEGRDVINQESLPTITWDTVQYKPFETETAGGNTLEWDGNTNGLVYATADGNEYFKLYKVSDTIPLFNEFNGGHAIINVPGNEKIALYFGNEFIEATNDNDELIGYLATDLTFAVAYEDNAVIQNYILPEAGLYLCYEGDDYMAAYTSSLTLDGYTGFPSEKLKVDRLPEHLQFGRYEIKSNTLTWDGSYTDETSVDWYKWVNRSTPTPEQLDGGTFRYTYHGETHTVTIDINDSSMVEIGENYVSISNFGIIIYEPNVAPWSEGTVFPNPGIYIEYWYGEYADTLTLLEYVLFIPALKKIDEIYLPDTVATCDEVLAKVHPVGSGTFSLNRKADTSIGSYSFAEGYNVTASGNYSHAEGNETVATGLNAHSEGLKTSASGTSSHAEGDGTKATSYAAHAEGVNCEASGLYSHAEGLHSFATNHCAHAEGCDTAAEGENSHAEGKYSEAMGENSHAEGDSTIASGTAQHVQGKYNVEDTENIYAHIVGKGQQGKRSNAHTLDWSGNAWFSGDVYVGSTSGTNKDEGSKKLVTTDEVYTKAEVDALIAEVIDSITKIQMVTWEAND